MKKAKLLFIVQSGSVRPLFARTLLSVVLSSFPLLSFGNAHAIPPPDQNGTVVSSNQEGFIVTGTTELNFRDQTLDNQFVGPNNQSGDGVVKVHLPADTHYKAVSGTATLAGFAIVPSGDPFTTVDVTGVSVQPSQVNLTGRPVDITLTFSLGKASVNCNVYRVLVAWTLYFVK